MLFRNLYASGINKRYHQQVKLLTPFAKFFFSFKHFFAFFFTKYENSFQNMNLFISHTCFSPQNYPKQRDNLVGADIEEGFFKLGFALFKDEIGESGLKRSNFVNANFVDWTSDEIQKAVGDTTFDLAYCGSVYHLAPNYEWTVKLTQNIASILKKSSDLSTVFFGRTSGLESGEPKLFDNAMPGRRSGRFLHSVQSLKKLLEDCGFQNVRVDSGRSDMDNDSRATTLSFLAFI